MLPVLLAAAACRTPMMEAPEVCKRTDVPEGYEPIVKTATESGQLVSWPVIDGQTIVDIYIDDASIPEYLDAGEVVSAMERSFWTWEDELNQSVYFELHVMSEENEEEDTGVSPYGYYGIVYFADQWTADPKYLAQTSTSLYSSGSIQSFEIAVNADLYNWGVLPDEGLGRYNNPDETHDVQAVMTHEIGHGIGFADLEDCEEPEDKYSVMCQGNTAGDVTERTLFDYDTGAVEAVYGECTAQ